VIKVYLNKTKINHFLKFILGYIDLSKRRVSPEDISKCEERFVRGKTVGGFFIFLKLSLWKYLIFLGKQYSSSYS
jgi:translation initiation factor 2 alpha subunit (eIF-2alpha)